MDIGWSARTFLGEVARSVRSRPFSFLVVVLVMAGGSLAAGTLDMVAWRDDARLLAEQEAAGSLVIRASAGDGSAAISTSACLSLNRSGGVRAAGGVGVGTLVHPATSPGLGFRVLPAAGRIIPALTGSADRTDPGLIVADAVAEQVGLATGSRIVVDAVPTTVSAVAPLGQRDPRLGRVGLDLGAPPPALVACYVAFTDDYALQALSSRLPATFAATDQLQLTRLLTTGQGTPDPAQLWDSRAVRDLYLPLGLLAAVVHALVVRGQRHEYSIYLVTGSTRAEVAFMILVGGHAATIVGTALSAAWLALLGRLWHVPGHGLQLGLLAATRTGLVVAVLLPLGLAWLVRANLHRLLRERGS